MLYRASLEGVMSPQMSLSGYNFDVVSGLAAGGLLLASLWVTPPRWVLWSFNALGLTLMTIILGIAIASMPSFAAFGPTRTNTWIAYFPYLYLPAIMVQLALLGHLLSIRKLVGETALGTVKDTRDTAPNRLRGSET
jgi:hypothetical protein